MHKFMLLFLAGTVAAENQTLGEAIRNTLIVPLKQIHDALAPLEQISEDVSNLASRYQRLSHCGAVSAGSDCADLYMAGHRTSGVYFIYVLVAGQHYPVSVYCDMETDGGGWLVFQRREDGSEDFYRSWDSYRRGFGNVTQEFWLGNSFLHMLTAEKTQELRVDLMDHEGHTRYAKYERFHVESQLNDYALNVSRYRGTAGDSLATHNGQRFSTRDHDNDSGDGVCTNAARGGWWYNACFQSNLNGVYKVRGSHNSSSYDNISWYHWLGHHYSLKRSEMKIRPLNFH